LIINIDFAVFEDDPTVITDVSQRRHVCRHWRVEHSPETIRQGPSWECRLVPERPVLDLFDLVIRAVEEVIRCLAQGEHVEGKAQQRPPLIVAARRKCCGRRSTRSETGRVSSVSFVLVGAYTCITTLIPCRGRRSTTAPNLKVLLLTSSARNSSPSLTAHGFIKPDQK
jgi:hypothetical protein